MGSRTNRSRPALSAICHLQTHEQFRICADRNAEDVEIRTSGIRDVGPRSRLHGRTPFGSVDDVTDAGWLREADHVVTIDNATRRQELFQRDLTPKTLVMNEQNTT